MSDNTEQLRLCPFCNGNPTIEKNEMLFWGECESCGSRGPIGMTKDEARIFWNGDMMLGRPSA
jgi:hypothetical protein